MTIKVPARRSTLRALALGLAAALGACSSIDGPSPVTIPNEEWVVSRSLSIPADSMVLIAGALLVIDPLAPNWRIEQYDLGGDRYAIALVKKRFSFGGDGEAAQVFRRRVDQLAREHGFASYEVLEFTAGIESYMPIAQRVSHGLVQFARAAK
jgi:hypothetical protein